MVEVTSAINGNGPSSGAGEGTASNRYTALRYAREPYLIRARRLSRLTVPSLFREVGENGTTTETIPWQSLGGQCVNNLAAKMVMALFPPGISFVNLRQTKQAIAALNQMDPDTRGKLKAEIDKGLSKVEQELIEGIEEDGDRVTLFDTARHLIVGGSHCIKLLDRPSDTASGSCLQSIPLEEHVTLRDGSGRLIEWLIESPMAWETLPADIKRMALDKGYQLRNDVPTQACINVYTHGCWRDGQWSVYQEAYGEHVPGSEWTYTEEALPYLFLRMVALKHEDYGRSYAEDYEGDLQTLDGYWQILTEGSAANALTKYLVKPGGVTNKKQFAELPNGGVMTGDVEDVAAFHADKQADLQQAVALATRVEQRLQVIFVMDTSVRRDGERVTAEEIRLMARALEATLGGVYSNQVTTWQLPYARLKMASLQRQKRVTSLPKGTTKMTIVTGDAALGRQQKAQALDEFIQTASALLGEQIIAPYINVETYLNRSAANRAIDTDGLVKSEEDVQQAQQQAMAAQTASAVAPEVVRQGGQMMQTAQQAGLSQSPSQPAAPPQPAQGA